MSCPLVIIEAVDFHVDFPMKKPPFVVRGFRPAAAGRCGDFPPRRDQCRNICRGDAAEEPEMVAGGPCFSYDGRGPPVMFDGSTNPISYSYKML